MAELILTIPNTAAGNVALEHLRSRALRDLGCEYRASLSQQLTDLNAGVFLERLPFRFHLVAAEDGREAAVANRIMRWHSREVPDYPYGRVESVEPNLPLFPLAALGLPFQLGGDHGTYVAQMQVPTAHQNNTTGAGIRVAILDTGLDSGAAPKAHDFFDVQNTNHLHPVPPAPVDNDGHGTAMAELMHAVAPDAQIYVVRVLDTGNLNLWNLLAGMSIAVADCEADIVNLSLGFSSMMQKCPGCGAPLAIRSLAFEKLTDTAIPGTGSLPTYVAATGNSSSTSSFDFPACSEKCMAIGAVDSMQQRSFFSNYGISHKRYLMAPGGQETSGLFTEDVGKGGGSNSCAGTSVSAAYVSGMLALFRSESRYATLPRDNFINSILTNHCILPSHAQGKPTEYGSGVIEYSPPAQGLDTVPDSGTTAAKRTWSDGEYVYLGDVRVKVNKKH